MDEIRSVKTTQIELQEAQAEIMEALSAIQQASQKKEHFVTPIDLQNLKKELSNEFRNELVDEIRKIYEEIANISITHVNINGSREEVVKHADKDYNNFKKQLSHKLTWT